MRLFPRAARGRRGHHHDGDDAPRRGLLLSPRGAGAALTDGQGRGLTLHGINATNFAKYAPDHLTWEQPEDFQALAAAGFNVVRLLTFWSAIMPEEGVIDTAYLDAYAERVAWAQQAGLLVVVDMHQDLFGPGFSGGDGAPLWACPESYYASFVPQSPWYVNYLSPEVTACFDQFYASDELRGRFEDAWRAVAARVADNPAVLGFDLLNEPFYGSQTWGAFITDTWQPLLTHLSAEVLSVAPGKLVFWEGLTMSSIGHVDPFTPPADPRVVFAPHYYLSSFHDGAPYDESQAPVIDGAFDGIEQTREALGSPPLWMGEFGGPTEVAGFDAYFEGVLTRFAARRWGWAVYSDDKGDYDSFGLRNPDGTLKDHVAKRAGHPYARRVPGLLLDQSMDFAAGKYQARFRWEYDARLEVWAPPPATLAVTVTDGGAAVSCGASAEAPAGVLVCPALESKETPPFGKEVTVTVTQP